MGDGIEGFVAAVRGGRRIGTFRGQSGTTCRAAALPRFPNPEAIVMITAVVTEDHRRRGRTRGPMDPKTSPVRVNVRIK